MSYSTSTYSDDFYSGEAANIDLSVNDGIHASVSDNVNVVSNIHSVTNDGDGVTSTNISLSENQTLVINSSVHVLASDRPTLNQVHVLIVNPSVNGINSDKPSFTQLHVLINNNASHTTTSNDVVLSLVMHGPKIWTGSEWEMKSIKRYHSGHWQYVLLKRRAGTEWVLV